MGGVIRVHAWSHSWWLLVVQVERMQRSLKRLRRRSAEQVMSERHERDLQRQRDPL